MTLLRTGVAPALLLVGGLLVGCTGTTTPPPGATSVAVASPAPSDASSAPSGGPATAEPTAGPDVAVAAATLPAGTATGSVLVTYTGLGQLASAASGTCSHPGGGSTALELRAGSATITVTLDGGGARLDLQDTGVEQHDVLAAGGYTVSGPRLQVDTGLTGDAGHLTLDVTCG